MDISELKKLINNSTSVLVLDNGEPSFVILGYETYRRISSDQGEEKEIKINPVKKSPTSPSPSSNGFDVSKNFQEREAQILERLNKEILSLKNQIDLEEARVGGTHNQTIDPALEK